MGRVVRVTSISLKLCVIIIASYSLGSYLFVLEVPVINMSLEIIKNDQECKRLLGDDIKVLSRSLWSYIRLDSYIPSQKILELNGREQLIMQFLVKGKIAQGEVHLEMTRAPKERFQYQFLYLDVIDSDNLLHRVWLVNSNKVKNQSEKREFFLNLWGLR
ncbi:hypothetical protein PCANB_001402 [Pneumocystis canis]|nr:hypothetical protein PCANB_001402 [Pneumocystis canis]